VTLSANIGAGTCMAAAAVESRKRGLMAASQLAARLRRRPRCLRLCHELRFKRGKVDRPHDPVFDNRAPGNHQFAQILLSPACEDDVELARGSIQYIGGHRPICEQRDVARHAGLDGSADGWSDGTSCVDEGSIT
jgi:hypothetical protein